MEGLKNKRKRHDIGDIERRLVDKSLFTTYVLTKKYQIKIHHNKDDDNLCFTLWLHEGNFFSIMFGI
jgi:hypothetical protein